MAETPERIPVAMSKEVRRLAHDLSNALEVIIQASYLLGMMKLDDESRKWAQMVDQGAQQAAGINRELREFIRANAAE
jgi:hypothetical protein